MAHRYKLGGVLTRLPEHYLKYRLELSKPSTAVHYIPESVNFKKDAECGEVTRVQTVPITVKKSPAQDQGLWGGEEIIRGFKKPSTYRRFPAFWVPVLKKSVVYSEIFDKYISVIVTERTLQLIDKFGGFDSYILREPIQDLKSQLALDLKRKMLLALVRKDFLTDNLEKQERLYQKYKDCVIPENEAEWYGLTIKEACTKQKILETEANQPIPLKIQFRKDLIEQLKAARDTKEAIDADKSELNDASWLRNLNPFSKKA